MKSRLVAIAACCLVATWVATLVTAQDAPKPAEATAAPEGMIRHVVFFKFKEGTTQADIEKVEKAFAALPEKIEEIADFEWGTNNSPEKHDKGFTHCFLLTFDSAADRDAYLPHPAHKEFGTILRPYLEDVTVIDFAPEAENK